MCVTRSSSANPGGSSSHFPSLLSVGEKAVGEKVEYMEMSMLQDMQEWSDL